MTTAEGRHEGSCLCGAVRYAVDGGLGEFGYCHCTSCRKASGSAHGANVGVERDRFHLLAGADVLREYESSPGKVRVFCSTCGSPIYAYLRATPEVLRVRLGSLDTPFMGRPRAHTWVSDKAPWEPIEDSVPQFSEWAPRSVLLQAGRSSPRSEADASSTACPSLHPGSPARARPPWIPARGTWPWAQEA